MNIFDRIFNRNVNQVQTAEDLNKALYRYSVTSGVAKAISDDPESYINEGYSGNIDVYSIIHKITLMSRQGKVKLMQKQSDGKLTEVTSHPLNNLLFSINPNMSFNLFWEASHIYKLAVGNNYWFKPMLTAGANKGKTNELHIMPAQFTEVVFGDWMNPVRGYKLNFDPVIEFEKELVFHQKFFDPRFNETHFLYGISPLKAAAQTVAKLNEAEKTEQKAFENSSPPYILYRKPDNMTGNVNFTNTQVSDMEKKLRKYRNDEKRGGPIVTTFVPGIERIGVSPVDLNIINSSWSGLRKLCNIYGIPPELLGDPAGSTYNNVSTARRAAWTDCLIPLNNDFCNDLTSFLINPVEEYRKQNLVFIYDTSDVQDLQESMVDKVNWMLRARWTPNEIREATGKPAIKDEKMDQPYFSMGEIPLSEMNEESETIPLKNFGDYK